jgi:hypothetical protein
MFTNGNLLNAWIKPDGFGNVQGEPWISSESACANLIGGTS